MSKRVLKDREEGEEIVFEKRPKRLYFGTVSVAALGMVAGIVWISLDALQGGQALSNMSRTEIYRASIFAATVGVGLLVATIAEISDLMRPGIIVTNRRLLKPAAFVGWREAARLADIVEVRPRNLLQRYIVRGSLLIRTRAAPGSKKIWWYGNTVDFNVVQPKETAERIRALCREHGAEC